MNAADLIRDLESATDAIWLEEPEEIRTMRLGVFTSNAGSYDQFFSNLVFINGDMRALSTWITPTVIMNGIDDDSFSLGQVQKMFGWANLVFVDFLAYCGFTRYATFAQEVASIEVASKDELREVLVAWYAYANRMYLWVHQVFPWGLGAAFPKLSDDDVAFIQRAKADTSVEDYFAEHMPTGLIVPPPAPSF